MAHVLIIGASKGIGLETVKAALEAGHRVRAMARSAGAIAVDHGNLERFAGDARDRAAVDGALADIDVVIQTLGLSPGPDLFFKPVRLFSEATTQLVAAMQAAGVRRLLCVTGFGAGDSRNRGGFLYNAAFSLFLGRAYADKDVQERIIRESSLDWIIVRPTILTDRPRTGRYKVLVDPRRWRSGFISRADVADFLVKQIDSDTYLKTTPVLTD